MAETPRVPSLPVGQRSAALRKGQLSDRVYKFCRPLWPIMLPGLQKRILTNPDKLNNPRIETLLQRLTELLSIQSLTLRNSARLDLGNLTPPLSIVEGTLKQQVCRLAENLGIHFAYSMDNNLLVLGTRKEVETGINRQEFGYHKRIEKPARSAEAGEESPATLSNPSPTHSSSYALLVAHLLGPEETGLLRHITTLFLPKGKVPRQFINPAFRVRRIKTLIREGEFRVASTLLFGSGISPELTEAMIVRNNLQPHLADLCEAGQIDQVADFFCWLVNQRGAKAVCNIIYGQAEIASTQVPVTGFVDPSVTARILFKMSVKDAKAADSVFKESAQSADADPGIIGEGLRELHRLQPRIFRNTDEYYLHPTSVFQKNSRPALQAINARKKKLEIPSESIAPELKDIGTKPSAPFKPGIIPAHANTDWDFEYGMMAPREMLIASVQELAGKGDYASACALIFAVDQGREWDEITNVLSLTFLSSEQICGILCQMDRIATDRPILRRFLVIAANAGYASRRQGNLVDMSFDGLVLALPKMEAGSLVDLFDTMIQAENRSQRKAAYFIIHEGVDPFKEECRNKYYALIDALYARRPDEYQPYDLLLHGCFCVEDKAPKKLRAQITFFEDLMKNSVKPSAVCLQAMLRLVHLGAERKARAYIKSELTKERYMAMVEEIASAKHPLVTFHNLDGLMSLVDYDCTESIAENLKTLFPAPLDSRISRFLDYLHKINQGMALFHSSDKLACKTGQLMLLGVKDRRLIRKLESAKWDQDKDIQQAFLAGVPDFYAGIEMTRNALHMTRRLLNVEAFEVLKTVYAKTKSPEITRYLFEIAREISARKYGYYLCLEAGKLLVEIYQAQGDIARLSALEENKIIQPTTCLQAGKALVEIYKEQRNVVGLSALAVGRCAGEVRLEAGKALAEVGAREVAVANLLALAMDKEGYELTRIEAWKQLAKLGKRAEALASLLLLAGEEERPIDIRLEAGMALAELGARQEAVSNLLALAKDGKVPANVQIGAWKALVELGEREEAVASLLLLARNEQFDTTCRIDAWETMAGLGAREEAIAGLLVLANDEKSGEYLCGYAGKALLRIYQKQKEMDGLSALANNKILDDALLLEIKNALTDIYREQRDIASFSTLVWDKEAAEIPRLAAGKVLVERYREQSELASLFALAVDAKVNTNTRFAAAKAWGDALKQLHFHFI
ncbi:MAG: HEAT repeat domain-containing protein [Candidatus Margulisiibacteriota bacterium]